MSIYTMTEDQLKDASERYDKIQELKKKKADIQEIIAFHKVCLNNTSILDNSDGKIIIHYGTRHKTQSVTFDSPDKISLTVGFIATMLKGIEDQIQKLREVEL